MNFGILDVVPKQLEILNNLKEYGNVTYYGNLDKKELLNALPGLDVLLIRIYKVDAEILQAAPHLTAVIKAGIGVDHIDVEEATRQKTHVVISPGNHISVAETAAMLMMAVARELPQKNKNTDENMHLLGIEMYEKTLGLVGFGRIGKQLAQLAGVGMGMNIIAYDPFLSEEQKKETGYRFIDDLDELIKESDVLSLHCPLTKSTHHMIDRRRLELMKPKAILVNTSRGAVIDEAALVEVLKEGHLHGAGLDVVEVEPLQPDNPLLALDNVIVSPHRLAQTPESIMRQAQSMFESAISFSKGIVPEESINQKKF